MRKKSLLSLCSALLFGAVLIYGCSDGDDTSGDTTGTSTDQTYTGPGSFYTAEIKADGEFTITVKDSFESTSSASISGTYTRLDTGFLKMTVASTSGFSGNDGPSAGDQAFALEIPGFALILKPIGGDEIIPMLISGNCPSEDFVANWLIAQNSGGDAANDANRDWLGTFSYVHSDSPTASLPAKRNLTGFDNLPSSNENFNSLACNNGFLQIMDGNRVAANMWLTSLGGAMVETIDENTNQRDQTILALPQQSITLADLAGDYATLVLQGSATNSDDKIFPALATLDAVGNGTGQELTNVETGTTESGGVTFGLGNANVLAAGWVTGTISSGSSSGNLACTGAVNVAGTSKKLLFCVGQDPGDNSKQFALVMVSK